jgi:lauroyl/myristoyl acyltransferase
MNVFHRGFLRSGFPEHMEFGPSVLNLDRAVAKGKGVVLASPHQFCYELGAAYINLRHRTVALIRERGDPKRQSIKEHWYRATGMDTVRRPRHGSIAGDMFAFLRVLKEGGILGVTPDIITSKTTGVSLEMFRRTVSLSPGFVLLAMKAKVPLVTCYFRWKTDDRIVLEFTDPIEYSSAGDRRLTVAKAVQQWGRECEQYIRNCPENWIFWLDKRWTRAFRSPAVGTGFL